VNLRNTLCTGHERRTKIDIVFEKVVEHVDAEIKTCPQCTAEVKGQFPKEFAGPRQYGAGIKAYLINLLMAQMVALTRTQKMVKTLIGEVIAGNRLRGVQESSKTNKLVHFYPLEAAPARGGLSCEAL